MKKFNIQGKEIETEELENYKFRPKVKFSQVIELRDRINKTIEYVEDENIDITTIRFNDIQDVKKDLLDILKGVDKDEN